MAFRYLIPLLVFTAIAGVFAYLLLSGHDPQKIPSALIDRPAPAFDLEDFHDSSARVSNADFTGRVTVVNMFASWCLPCQAEHPLITRLAEEVPVIGINYKDKRTDATRWLERLGDPYARIAVDATGRMGIDWGVYGLPETFVIDAEGHIRYKHVGPLTPHDFEEVVMPIIRELRS